MRLKGPEPKILQSSFRTFNPTNVQFQLGSNYQPCFAINGFSPPMNVYSVSVLCNWGGYCNPSHLGKNSGSGSKDCLSISQLFYHGERPWTQFFKSEINNRLTRSASLYLWNYMRDWTHNLAALLQPSIWTLYLPSPHCGCTGTFQKARVSGNHSGGLPWRLPTSSRWKQNPAKSVHLEDVVFSYLRFSAQHSSETGGHSGRRPRQRSTL